MKWFVTVVLLAAGLAGAASAGVTQYSSRAEFLAAAGRVTTIDFGVAATPVPGSFTPYAPPTGITLSGVNFTTLSGAGAITVVSRSFCCQTYNRGGFDQLSSDANGLKVTLPAGTTAVGFDLFTVDAGNYGGLNSNVVDINVNGSVYRITTVPSPNMVFVGFVSTTPITTFTVVAEQASLGTQADIENFSFKVPSTAVPPFGTVDTPANNSAGLTGALGVTGWALGSNLISKVSVWRDPLAGEGTSLVYLADATMIPGARPDVAGAYPIYPHNDYGWGVQVLTNELPGVNGQPLGNGTYKLHAIATDSQGVSTDLSGPITVTANNSTATLPFGTIDTPAQGGVVTGSAVVNFGWVVTPNPANVIPKDGSTITVFIDGLPVGHPVYNNFRADIATLFPGLQNSAGAVGYFIFDSTKLTNGLHTISWTAVDSAGRAQGLGSRFFIVQNT